MSKEKPHRPLFHRIIKPDILLRFQNQISHALVQFRKRASQKMNKLRRHNHNKDRLSDLPDCVLLHILSFFNTKRAVQICLLSKRWNHLWKYLPTLTLRNHDFQTGFVNHILSLRDPSTAINALDFQVPHWVEVEPRLLKIIAERIVSYAVSHNFNHIRIWAPLPQIPPSLFSCPSLTSLYINAQNTYYVTFPNSLNLPALTYLELLWFSFDTGNDGPVQPFSGFTKLNTLILGPSIVTGAHTLSISNITLLNLSIYLTNYNYGGYWKVELSAPNLCTFDFVGTLFHKFYGSSFSSIKQVSIFEHSMDCPMEACLGLLNWLIEMSAIKSLTITPRTLEVLSSVPEILQLKLPSLCNLKLLKLDLWRDGELSMKTLRDIKLELAGGKSWKENVKLRETIKAGLEPICSSILDGMIDLLLQNSPSAKVDIVLRS